MKNKIFAISFLIIIYGFMLISIILPDKEISYTEKRYLKEFPAFEISNEYSNKLESYLLDQFPMRDTFRSIKAYFNYKILLKEENNDIILNKNDIYKTIYPTDYKSINKYLDYINNMLTLLDKNNNVYILLVPDKNYYIDNNYYPNIDYDYIYNEINKLNLTTIDIRNILNRKDFYFTDTHWRQENLDKVLTKFLNTLNIPKENIEYKKHNYNNFYGVFANESALKNKKDNLIFLTNEYIDNAIVYYLENSKLNKVYNEEKLDSFDSYEAFLDGASAYIEINSPISNTDKELVVFRDSFASSFVPLLIPYYKKITIIDNRYIGSKSFKDMINFTNQDILFLNSTLLVNQSYTLKN